MYLFRFSIGWIVSQSICLRFRLTNAQITCTAGVTCTGFDINFSTDVTGSFDSPQTVTLNLDYLVSGGDWRAAVWGALSIVIAMAVYYPFAKIAERQRLNAEAAGTAHE